MTNKGSNKRLDFVLQKMLEARTQPWQPRYRLSQHLEENQDPQTSSQGSFARYHPHVAATFLRSLTNRLSSELQVQGLTLRVEPPGWERRPRSLLRTGSDSGSSKGLSSWSLPRGRH